MPVENMTLAPFYAGNRNPYNYAKVEQVSRDVVTQWLTTDEITNQLNLFDDESQDGYVRTLELATRMVIEDYLGMAIFATQWRTYYANLGVYNTQWFLDLPEVTPGANGVTINSVQVYTDSNTVPVTLSGTSYSYDPTGNRVILNELPNNLNQNIVNPIVVTYTQNANSMAAYPVIKQAGLMLLTHIYNNRSNTTDMNLKEIPFGVSQLLRPYKPLVM
jgi:hypothetical protein